MPVVQILRKAGYVRDFFSLVYPRSCEACGNSLFRHEQWLCNYCLLNLPKSHFHTEPGNVLEQVFYGRAPVERAASYYLFEKSGRVQQLLHSIKYRGNKELARQLGMLYAESLKETKAFSEADYLIPVPLHPKKQKQRGFNQSAEFARGLGDVLRVPLLENELIRTGFTSTQTRKQKFDRWENVKDVFSVRNPELLKGKKVVLVDDVITTGATIDACCQALGKAGGTRISVLSLAYAKKD